MDGIVRIWDLRSTKGAVESFVATGDQHEEGADKKKLPPSKVLALDWSTQGSLIGCAGERGVDIFRVRLGS